MQGVVLSMANNKKIYIVLTHTGTVLSRIIKSYTKKEFSHVSISLDKDLNEMYSFGRLNPYNPINAGFVHEGINIGTFKRFKNTKAEVYSLDVTIKEYKRITSLIEKFKKKKKKYKFNIIGLIGVAFHKKIKKKDSFYCAEFVKYVLEKGEVDIKLPELIKPMDFKNIEKLNFEYHGKLKNYR